MIYTPHIIVGAAIGARTQDLGLIVIFAFLTHFIMDKLPHWDYAVRKGFEKFRKTKKIKYFFWLLVKISIDTIIGLLIVLIVVWKNNLFDLWPFIVLGIFFSLLPDFVVTLIYVFAKKKFTEKVLAFHFKYLHHPENKEKEGRITFLGLFTEILVIIISCVFLLNL